MFKIAFVFLVFVLINGVSSTTDQECEAKSGTNCDECLGLNGCAYCDDSKICVLDSLFSTKKPCDLEHLHEKTCFANARTLAIILGCAGGAVLILIIVVIICLCRKCKRNKLMKEQRHEAMAEQNRQERRAAAEVRSSDRARSADQLRMKYGILRDKENAADYKRFS